MEGLPNELLGEICGHLNYKDLQAYERAHPRHCPGVSLYMKRLIISFVLADILYFFSEQVDWDSQYPDFWWQSPLGKAQNWSWLYQLQFMRVSSGFQILKDLYPDYITENGTWNLTKIFYHSDDGTIDEYLPEFMESILLAPGSFTFNMQIQVVAPSQPIPIDVQPIVNNLRTNYLSSSRWAEEIQAFSYVIEDKQYTKQIFLDGANQPEYLEGDILVRDISIGNMSELFKSIFQYYANQTLNELKRQRVARASPDMTVVEQIIFGPFQDYLMRESRIEDLAKRILI